MKENEIYCKSCKGLIAVRGMHISPEQVKRLVPSSPLIPIKERSCTKCWEKYEHANNKGKE